MTPDPSLRLQAWGTSMCRSAQGSPTGALAGTDPTLNEAAPIPQRKVGLEVKR
jgi:hypothetical protein